MDPVHKRKRADLETPKRLKRKNSDIDTDVSRACNVRSTGRGINASGGGRFRHRKVQVDVEDDVATQEDESDEDMGFGLFDSGPAGERNNIH